MLDAWRMPADSGLWTFTRDLSELDSGLISSSHRGVLPNPTIPRQSRQHIGQRHPANLHREPANHFFAMNFAHVNANGKIELIRKRREIENLFEIRRQNI